MIDVDRMFTDYCHRTNQPLPVDGVHQFQLSYLRDTLRRLAAAMDDEAIPEETAIRLVRALLYGAPGVAEAELRVQQQERLVQAMSQRGSYFVGGPNP